MTIEELYELAQQAGANQHRMLDLEMVSAALAERVLLETGLWKSAV